MKTLCFNELYVSCYVLIVVGGRRLLHNEELRNLHASLNIITMIKSRRKGWPWHVARMGEMEEAYKILVGESERMRPLGRPRRMRRKKY
jgi:hypothetical protein